MELILVGHTLQTVSSGWSLAAKKLDATKKLDQLEKDQDLPFRSLLRLFLQPLPSLALAGREKIASRTAQV